VHLGGSVRVGADRDPVGALDERDGAAEAPERLRELEPDRARAQHEQRARQLGQPERSGAVEPRHLVDALDRRHGRARSRGDEDPLAGEQPVAHPHGGRVDELRRSVHQRDAEVGEALPPRLLRPHEPVRARLQRGQVEGDGTGADTQVCGRAQAREQLGGGDVLLRRLAGDVGAGAAPSACSTTATLAPWSTRARVAASRPALPAPTTIKSKRPGVMRPCLRGGRAVTPAARSALRRRTRSRRRPRPAPATAARGRGSRPRPPRARRTARRARR